MGFLNAVMDREWFRTRLSPYQLKRVFLGHEAGNDFSCFYSDGTYRIETAAQNLLERSCVTGPRKIHRERVIAYSQDIEVNHLAGVILCASRYCLNRKLKVFDGNHRLIAYYIRYQYMDPFECIIGLNKCFFMNILQRLLLRFPVKEKLWNSLMFKLKKNIKQICSLMQGGVHYQPIVKDPGLWKDITDVDKEWKTLTCRFIKGTAERPCLDRARLIHQDLLKNLGSFDGATLLDIGCNIGFFCHYFQSLGFVATGIDNNRHNQKQCFTIANSICVAKKLNKTYGLGCSFHDVDAMQFLSEANGPYDVVLLLSIIHHFFIGYSIGANQRDHLLEAHEFLRTVARVTGKILYIEYDETCTDLETSQLMEYVKNEAAFKDVEIIGKSSDFERPIIRCLRI